MPNSKHRRKGKIRKRVNLKNVPPRPPIDYDPEYERQQDALLMAQLQKIYGGSDWGDWTDAQIDGALAEIKREETARSINLLSDISRT